jgi:hypothetical protein
MDIFQSFEVFSVFKDWLTGNMGIGGDYIYTAIHWWTLAAVLAVQLLGFGALLTLVIQVLVGIVVYVAISAAAHLEPFRMVLDVLKGIKRKK